MNSFKLIKMLFTTEGWKVDDTYGLVRIVHSSGWYYFQCANAVALRRMTDGDRGFSIHGEKYETPMLVFAFFVSWLAAFHSARVLKKSKI